MKFEKIKYEDLNAKAKEMYNFQKVSARLADYGYTTLWLNNDWKGADFIAVHVDGVTDIKVQLKARLTFDKKYIGKNVYICFRDGDDYYLYPHDEILEQIEYRISDKKWVDSGNYSSGKLSKNNKELLKAYKI
ncbi:hypothetical protein [Desulfogranum japonicum]|uniref:hypothetical protein n=1 Tax=Desulfogranum japonicum TaxID=231447 RepID=UPI0003F88539|nr:hypothetical protein [Desulfogranum japonicum]